METIKTHNRLYSDVQADRSIHEVLFLHIVAHTVVRTVHKCKYKTRNAPFCR